MNNLKKIRGKHGLSQTELAERIGITKQALSLAEQGKVSAKTALKAAEVLGENVFEIMGEDLLAINPVSEADKEIVIKIIKEL